MPVCLPLATTRMRFYLCQRTLRCSPLGGGLHPRGSPRCIVNTGLLAITTRSRFVNKSAASVLSRNHPRRGFGPGVPILAGAWLDGPRGKGLLPRQDLLREAVDHVGVCAARLVISEGSAGMS